MHERIKELRKTLRLSQSQFAKRLGVTQVTVSTWESGRCPKFAAPMICQKFNVNPDWLENGRGEMFVKSRPERETFVESMFAMYQELSPERQKLWRVFARRILANDWREETVESFARSVTDVLQPEPTSHADATIDFNRDA